MVNDMKLAVDSKAAFRSCFAKQVFLKTSQYSEESTCDGVSFNKVTDLKACSFIKKKLQHRCFPVNIVKFLKTAFLHVIQVIFELRFFLLRSTCIQKILGKTKEIYIKLLDTCFVCNDCSQLELVMKLTLIAVPYKTNIQ